MTTTVTMLAEEIAHAYEIEDHAPVGSKEAADADDLAANLRQALPYAKPQSLDECLSSLAIAATFCDPAGVPVSMNVAVEFRQYTHKAIMGVIEHLLAAGATSPLQGWDIDLAKPRH